MGSTQSIKMANNPILRQLDENSRKQIIKKAIFKTELILREK